MGQKIHMSDMEASFNEMEGRKMGYSRYRWLVIRNDGSTETIEAETIEAETIDEVVNEINDAQPMAIIKMDFC